MNTEIKRLSPQETKKGTPFPLGPSIFGNHVNFALISQQAEAISLVFFDREDKQPVAEISLIPSINKTGDIWHIAVPHPGNGVVYAYLIYPKLNEKQHFILDPYCKSLFTPIEWGKRQKTYFPLGELPQKSTFDWEGDTSPQVPLNDSIIYEMHVRAFTKDDSSKVLNSGSFLGVIEKIPHLIDLGITAIELLPIQEFNECEYPQHPLANEKNLCNFWGYSTVNFFAPMNRYSSSDIPESAINEFKTMVKALHLHGIEIILDVVFNHTAEGNENGPVISYKALDNELYYILGKKQKYLNFSGCGNTLNSNHPVVLEMLISCLRYWVCEMHVDGFRFDLASALTRGKDGIPLDFPPLINAITDDPILSKVKLIAEPWDAAGLYHVGNFAAETPHWSEWNGKYRDGVRRFIKGLPGMRGEFATRLCGSSDLYFNRGPCSSINFITSHDGFSLADLVSYNFKHNLENGEKNQDGTNENESWNCGVEGTTSDKKIIRLRVKQMKNFHVALMLSQGVPMLTMGDEYGHTKQGNNNSWCQDNSLNWFLWDKLDSNHDFFRFYKLLINFRKLHPILRRKTFLSSQDITWHGIEPFKADWANKNPFLAFTLKNEHEVGDLFVAFNAQDHCQSIILPSQKKGAHWHLVLDTDAVSPEDIFDGDSAPIYFEKTYKLASYSSIILKEF